MNNTLRLFIACLLMQAAFAADACWYATYSPIEYYTCRIPEIECADNRSMVDIWHRTLLPDVDTDEISKLIFSENGYTVGQIRKLQVSPALRKHLTADNNALLEYVCTMRQVNDRRAEMSNPWYYYYAGEPKSAKLNVLADTCLKRLDTRYGDRYALLAARALNTLKRYPEIDSIARCHEFRDKEMEAIFLPEYAGVLYNMGRYEEAADIYSIAGDISSLIWCLKKLGLYQNRLSAISRLADLESNYNLVVNELSSYVHSLEKERYIERDCVSCSTFSLTDVGILIETSHARSAVPGRYRTVWRYAEAMGWLIYRNDFAKADSVLTLIDTSKVDSRFAKSIRTLKFITRSSVKSYDAGYLPWVVSEATWLISQSDEERKGVPDDYFYEDDIMFSRQNHYSKLYYSDMLHKAADVIIVPRMLEHGDTLAALQLLDTVEYANLSDNEVRKYDIHGNAPACFAMECGADVIIEALARSHKPLTPLDRLWTRIGSIRYADRWYDFAGTALLAEGRYKEAIPYLQKVSPRYFIPDHIAFTGSILNPFAAELRADYECHQKSVMMATPSNYKLWFACEMSQLEDIIGNRSIDDEKRAEAKFRYGVGMANSVYPCWYLTKYGEGETVFSPWVDESGGAGAADIHELIHDFNIDGYIYDRNEVDPFARSHRQLSSLRRKGEKHIFEALGQIKNPETIATCLKAMAYYKTIKHHYSDTSVAREMRSKCDNWDMY